MAYAFSIQAFDLRDDEDGSKTRTRYVTVTVIADNEEAAVTKAKELATRASYEVDSVVELTELNPSKSSY